MPSERIWYRAYCDECHWESPYRTMYDGSAYEDLNQHVQEEHAGLYGIREERES